MWRLFQHCTVDEWDAALAYFFSMLAAERAELINSFQGDI